MWALMLIHLVSSEKTAFLHLEFPACTMKRMTVVKLLGTAGLINYCNITTASSHKISRASLFVHTQEAPQVFTAYSTGKGSRRGSCILLEIFEQQLLPSHWEKSPLFYLAFSLQQAHHCPEQPQLSRGTEHLWVSYSVSHLLSVKNQIIEIRNLGREIRGQHSLFFSSLASLEIE